MLALLPTVQVGDLLLLNSAALEYEISRIPDVQRRSDVSAILTLAGEYLALSSEAEKLAEFLEQMGISGMDAVHVAIASTAEADFFGTCDDRLLQRVQRVTDLKCSAVSVLRLVEEVLK